MRIEACEAFYVGPVDNRVTLHECVDSIATDGAMACSGITWIGRLHQTLLSSDVRAADRQPTLLNYCEHCY